MTRDYEFAGHQLVRYPDAPFGPILYAEELCIKTYFGAFRVKDGSPVNIEKDDIVNTLICG